MVGRRTPGDHILGRLDCMQNPFWYSQRLKPRSSSDQLATENTCISPVQTVFAKTCLHFKTF